MRPVKLSLQAFGPYAAEQVIDFDRLDGRSLFLISGPTGAGKSSILDALCYALYGESSGGERGEDELRSQLAAPDEPTRVELVFAKGDARYRVERSPRQPRPRKRGGGFTEQEASATLARRVAGRWQVIAGKPGRVTEEVQALLGFQVGQFRQVVILPQDQFRDLLVAGSQERERILATLFQTHLYRRFQEALREEYRSVDKEIGDLERANQGLLAEVGLDDRAALERVIGEAREGLAELEASLEGLEKEEQVCLDRRDKARAMAAGYEELDKAAQVLTGLEAGRDAQDVRESQLGQAEKAATLEGLFDDLTQRREEDLEAEHAFATAELALDVAQRQSRRAIKAFEREQGHQSKRKGAQQKLLKLEALVSIRDQWSAAQVRLDGLRAGAEQAAALAANSEGDLERTRSELEAREQELHDQAARAGEVTGLAAQVENAVRLLDAGRRRDALRTELAAAEASRERARAKRAKSEDGLQRQRDRLDGLLERQLAGQASVLAAGLVQGETCPVCGSTEHPRPARSLGKVPDEATVEAQRERVLVRETGLEKARASEDASTHQVAALSAQLSSTERELADRAARPVTDLERSEAGARRALQSARKADERARALADQIEDLKRTIRDGRAKASKDLEAATVARQALAGAEGEARELGRQVHHSYRPAGALETAIERAAQEAASLERALERARADRDAATQDLTARSEQAAGCRRDRSKKAGILARRQDAFDQRLKRAGFPSEVAFLAARLDADARETLGRRVDDFKAALGEARQRLSRAREATSGRERPDLTAVEETYRRARGALTDASGEHKGLTERVSFLGGKLAIIDRQAAEIMSLQTRFGLVGELAEAANDRGMTFERWVLSALLDEVLAAASVRLKRMSRDRFLLRRDLDQRDRRRAGGLDLRVFDAHTGGERSAASLSGGEGFMAALSLALGLADVVQAHAGGIRLDTLFVDEGFGALDPEALDQAFQTLVDLRSEGRLVGVISHVPELAARIDARLEIRPAGRGSRATWVL